MKVPAEIKDKISFPEKTLITWRKPKMPKKSSKRNSKKCKSEQQDTSDIKRIRVRAVDWSLKGPTLIQCRGQVLPRAEVKGSNLDLRVHFVEMLFTFCHTYSFFLTRLDIPLGQVFHVSLISSLHHALDVIETQ